MPGTLAMILPDDTCPGFCFLIWCFPAEIYWHFVWEDNFTVLQEVLNSWPLATKCHRTGFVMVINPNTPTRSSKRTHWLGDPVGLYSQYLSFLT